MLYRDHVLPLPLFVEVLFASFRSGKVVEVCCTQGSQESPERQGITWRYSDSLQLSGHFWSDVTDDDEREHETEETWRNKINKTVGSCNNSY